MLISVSLCLANARALELLSLRTPGIREGFFVLYGLFRSTHLDALLGAGAYAGAAFNAL